MNKTELQQKIVDMEKQLAELKKELEKKDKGIWKPDGNYYFVWGDGFIGCDTNQGLSADIDRFNFGNYYKTEEEAEKMANYLKYTNLLRKYVEEHSEPLDWTTSSQEKYYIYYNFNEKVIKTLAESYCSPNQGTIYASSKEVLKEAIEFIGEDNVKKHIFGVEE